MYPGRSLLFMNRPAPVTPSSRARSASPVSTRASSFFSWIVNGTGPIFCATKLLGTTRRTAQVAVNKRVYGGAPFLITYEIFLTNLAFDWPSTSNADARNHRRRDHMPEYVTPKAVQVGPIVNYVRKVTPVTLHYLPAERAAGFEPAVNETHVLLVNKLCFTLFSSATFSDVNVRL